jgi:hypothetical protein
MVRECLGAARVQGFLRLALPTIGLTGAAETVSVGERPSPTK